MDEFATDRQAIRGQKVIPLYLIEVENGLKEDGTPTESATLYEAGAYVLVEISHLDIRQRVEWEPIWHFDDLNKARASAELDYLIRHKGGG